MCNLSLRGHRLQTSDRRRRSRKHKSTPTLFRSPSAHQSLPLPCFTSPYLFLQVLHNVLVECRESNKWSHMFHILQGSGAKWPCVGVELIGLGISLTGFFGMFRCSCNIGRHAGTSRASMSVSLRFRRVLYFRPAQHSSKHCAPAVGTIGEMQNREMASSALYFYSLARFSMHWVPNRFKRTSRNANWFNLSCLEEFHYSVTRLKHVVPWIMVQILFLCIVQLHKLSWVHTK